jgi:hypothetical protein
MDVKKILLIIMLFVVVKAQAQTDTTKTDSAMLKKIQEEMQQPPAPSPQQRTGASANPDISVIGDFRGLYRSYGKHNFDAVLNEAEFSFQSVIDPYARADFFYSVSQDPATGKFTNEIEEGYLTTLSLPAHLQLKAGRFREDLGRINAVHPHALPFIDMPDAYSNFFGEDGIIGDGVSLSWLLPNPAFFQELTFEGTNVNAGNPSFERSAKNNYLYLAHLKNFWDLSANSTIEFGLTGIRGENLQAGITDVASFDFTYKWKPVRFNTYQMFTFQNEFYYSHAQQPGNTVINAIGFYSMVYTQVGKRTFLTGKFDYSNSPTSNIFVQKSGSITLGWEATEFQKIEIEAKYTTMNEGLEEYDFDKNFMRGFVRWIFVIGSHGAHRY